jgi:IMP cyclohydrolase
MTELSFENHIKGNPYPGRGIVVGLSPDSSEIWQIYWIMGRSPNSRNRVFEVSDNILSTKPADPAKCEDPSLVIYKAMLEHEKHFVVSNGDQTQTVYDSISKGGSFEEALFTREREPDAPNFTPRITAMVSLDTEPRFRFSIIKANGANSDISDHNFYYKNKINPGKGFCITTYLGDGNPIPSFNGEPYELDLSGNKEDVLNKFWEALDNDNKISVALKSINLSSKKSQIDIINKY